MSKIKLEYISVGGRVTGAKSDEEAIKTFRQYLFDIDLLKSTYLNPHIRVEHHPKTNSPIKFGLDDIGVEDSNGTWHSVRAVFTNEI